jgi:hypothetical protein
MPGRDKRRVAATTEHYRRWEAELDRDLKGQIGERLLKSLEVQHRHFQDVSAPVAIRQAELDWPVDFLLTDKSIERSRWAGATSLSKCLADRWSRPLRGAR